MNTQNLKICGISRDHLQAMNPCSGGQHGIFTQGVGLAVHHPSPFPHDHSI
jgi:hypothetical protein